MTETATNDPEAPEPMDPLLAAEAAMLQATTRIKTLEQHVQDLQDLRDEAAVSRQKLIEEFKIQGTVIGWKVFLESVFYVAWLGFTLFVTFVPLYQALILRRNYVHLWGTLLGIISGWVFYLIIRDRPTFR